VDKKMKTIISTNMTSIKIALSIAAIATALIIVTGPTLAVQKVFAAPPPPTCTNGGGQGSTGSCTGNTDSNHKTCTAINSGLQKKQC
jgi:hypothetical protein